MTIRVARDLRKQIKDDPDGMVVQILECPDQVAAESALRRASRRIIDFGLTVEFGPKYVHVVPAGPGPVLYVDAVGTPVELLLTVPDIIVEELKALGITKAAIEPVGGGATLLYFSAPKSVSLVLFPPPPAKWDEFAEVPAALLEEVSTWLGAGRPAGSQLWAQVVSTEFSLPVDQVDKFILSCRSSQTTCLFVAGNEPTPTSADQNRLTYEELFVEATGRVGERARMVGGDFIGHEPRLALTSADANASGGRMVEMVEELKEVARRMAPHLAYAYISIRGGFPRNSGVWEGGAASGPWLQTLVDAIAFDAYHYQILGPGHLERLGGRPPGAVELAGGRIELEVGTAADWLDTLRAAGRTLLGPCLLPDITTARRLREARQGAEPPEPAGGTLSAAPTHVPPMIAYGLATSVGGVAALQAKMNEFWRPLRLGLYASPRNTSTAGRLPPSLPVSVLKQSAAWLKRRRPHEWWAVLEGRPFEISSRDVTEVLAYINDHAGGEVVSLGPGGANASLHIRGGAVMITAGLAGVNDYSPANPPAPADEVALARSLEELARGLAPDLVYACLTVDAHPAWIPHLVELCDEFVGDASPYQILSEGHLARLDGPPPGARPLSDGRVELEIGEFTQWLPIIRDEGRRLLAPCLINSEEESRLLGLRRYGRPPAEPDDRATGRSLAKTAPVDGWNPERQPSQGSSLSSRREEVLLHQLGKLRTTAEDYRADADLMATRRVQEMMLARASEAVGPAHPFTLEVAGDLATTLSESGDTSGAADLLDKALAAVEERVRSGDIKMLSAAGSLARTARAHGRLDRARSLQAQALTKWREARGSEDVMTLSAGQLLSVLLYEQGLLSEARALQEELLATARSVLGPRDVGTTACAWSLYITLTEIDPEEAQALVERDLRWLYEADIASLAAEQAEVRLLLLARLPESR